MLKSDFIEEVLSACSCQVGDMEDALKRLYDDVYNDSLGRIDGQGVPTTELYFEAHITIEPVFGERLEELRKVAEHYGFRVADLLMQKRKEDTPERSKVDTFMTTRSKDYQDIHHRTTMCVMRLQNEHGFAVWRYKIEDTVLDVRIPH